MLGASSLPLFWVAALDMGATILCEPRPKEVPLGYALIKDGLEILNTTY
jgi:hypothetical protein